MQAEMASQAESVPTRKPPRELGAEQMPKSRVERSRSERGLILTEKLAAVRSDPSQDKVKSQPETVEQIVRRISSAITKATDFSLGVPGVEVRVQGSASQKATRSNTYFESEALVKVKDTPAVDMQKGYGEITYGSLDKLVREMLRCVQSSADDVWIDLGSGFGATLPQISYLTGVRTIGVEGDNMRAFSSLNQLQRFQSEYWHHTQVLALLQRCQVFSMFIEQIKGVVPHSNAALTHLYAFDLVMSSQSKEAILTLLRDFESVKCLATTQNEQAVFVNFGLCRQRFAKVAQISCLMKGCSGSN